MKIRLWSVSSVLLLAGAALVAPSPAKAQQQATNSGPSKYLYLSSVSVKPGSLEPFIKLQQEEIAAMRAAKAPGHFLAMEQITGSGLVLFGEGFDSFAGIQKTHEEVWSNKQLAATLRSDNGAQDALTREEHDSIYAYRKSLSLHDDQSLEDMRFMRIWFVEVKPGHNADFENIAKTEVKALGSEADVHWAVFEKMYGQGSDRVYLVVTPMKSLADVDTMIANRHKIREMVGEGLVHLVTTAEGKSISMSEDDLFVLAPKLSYVSDAWLTDSPDFWGEK